MFAQDFIARLDDILSDQFITVFVHHSKFQEGRFLDGVSGGIFLRFRQARQLDGDPVVAGRLDDRFRHAKSVDALPQHFYCVRKGGILLAGLAEFARIHLDQK